MLTFGLLSRDKGIENVIEALPAILARHPDVVYIVLGATHPHVTPQRGRVLPARARAVGARARRGGERRLPQSLREPPGARRVPRGRRHLRHPLPQRGPDHLGHPGLRRRAGQGDDLHALLVRPGAPGRRPRRSGALQRPGGHRRRGHRPASKTKPARHAMRKRAYLLRPGDDLARGRPLLHGELRALPAQKRSRQPRTVLLAHHEQRPAPSCRG